MKGGIRRYRRAPKLKRGKYYGTYDPGYFIYKAVQRGQIFCDSYETKQTERLDIIAGAKYGDGTLWWIIAAASGIGWNLQVPAGTYLAIPRSLSQIEKLIG